LTPPWAGFRAGGTWPRWRGRAPGASRAKGTYFHAQYHRLARRRGKHRAILAVAHSVVVVISHLPRDKRPYSELGPDYFDRLDTARTQQHHVRRLEQLGYTVTRTPAAA
jgi:transposase